MVGGVRFEHSHRMVAEFVGLLTVVLAIWLARSEKRRWVRILGWLAVGMVVAQGVLGGLTVLYFLPATISTAHAAVAQTFFCLSFCLALFTGRHWIEEVPQIESDDRRPSLFTLSILSVAVLYVQLVLGGMFRHHGLSWWPHVMNAPAVAFVLGWTAVRARTVYSKIAAIRRPAVIMLSLLIAQLCLGFVAFLTRVAWGKDAVQPELPMVIATVSHVAVGALLLATTVVLAMQVWRHVPVRFEERIPSGEREPIAA